MRRLRLWFVWFRKRRGLPRVFSDPAVRSPATCGGFYPYSLAFRKQYQPEPSPCRAKEISNIGVPPRCFCGTNRASEERMPARRLLLGHFGWGCRHHRFGGLVWVPFVRAVLRLFCFFPLSRS